MNYEDLRRIWDEGSAKYEQRSSLLSACPLPAEYLPHAGDKVLDAGCGAGNFLPMYQQIARAVFGLDFSFAMATAARRRGDVALGDVQRLPFANGEFTYVSSLLVINHVLDNCAALTELARVTQPCGRVVVLVPNRFSCLTPLRVLAIKLGKYSLGLCRHYTTTMLREEGAQNGLTLVRTCAVPKPPTAVNLLRYIPTLLGYTLDQIVRTVDPLWGGDLAVMFEKRSAD